VFIRAIIVRIITNRHRMFSAVFLHGTKGIKSCFLSLLSANIDAHRCKLLHRIDDEMTFDALRVNDRKMKNKKILLASINDLA
jgi:hypothetical protein